MFTFVGVLVVIVVLLLFASVQVLPEYQRGVVLTVGRYTGTKGPGLVLLLPIVQRMVRVDLRITVMDVPPQDVISRDNVSVRVNAVVPALVETPMANNMLGPDSAMLFEKSARRWAGNDGSPPGSRGLWGNSPSWLPRWATIASPCSRAAAKTGS